MVTAKIRLGVIGANAKKGWAPRSHLPAILSSEGFELTAVCTTRWESAEESARQYGARLAFHSHQEMLASSEIDAVAVVVRVPYHYQLTRDSLNAGKHTFTEWPLGKTMAEAQELAELARAKGVQTMVGLQARAAPALLYIKELVDTGYVGEVMSCNVSLIRDGVLQNTSERTWQRDDSLGATNLTIACGHTIDALRFVVGNLSQVSAVVTTQARQWLETDTQHMVDVTAPDNVLVSGRLANGAVASIHIAHVPWAGSKYRMEIYGRDGTLVVSSDESPQIRDVPVKGAKASDGRLQELKIPTHHIYVQEGMPQGEPFNVGQLYYLFAQAIRSGKSCNPNFDTAVELHTLLDTIRKSSDEGRQVAVPQNH